MARYLHCGAGCRQGVPEHLTTTPFHMYNPAASIPLIPNTSDMHQVIDRHTTKQSREHGGGTHATQIALLSVLHTLKHSLHTTPPQLAMTPNTHHTPKDNSCQQQIQDAEMHCHCNSATVGEVMSNWHVSMPCRCTQLPVC